MSKRLIIIVFVLLILGVAALAIAMRSDRRKAESVQCGNYIVAIGHAARLWANDHDERLPSDLLSMSNELNTPRILVCPGDYSRVRAVSWETFTPAANSSYEIITPRLPYNDTNRVFLRCKIHGYLGYADTTVFDGIRRRTKIF